MSTNDSDGDDISNCCAVVVISAYFEKGDTDVNYNCYNTTTKTSDTLCCK